MWLQARSSKVKISALFAAIFVIVSTTLPAVMAFTNNTYVTLSSFSGNPGKTITVSGGNFQSKETVQVTAKQNNVTVAQAIGSVAVDSTFNTAIALPANVTQGPVVITATGATSGLSSSNSYYVNPFTPELSITATSATPYSTLLVSGKGYASNESVILNLAGATSTATTDATGAFKNASLVVPNVPAASYQLIGVGQASTAQAIAYQYVDSFYASASPSSYYVMPLTQLAFNGSGFAVNEFVRVTEAKTGAVLSTITTDATGSFTNKGGFTVPASYAGGPLNVVLTGVTSKASATTSTVVGQYYPSVSPTVYYVMPGGSVSFDGSGFVPGETVTVSQNNKVLSSAVADSFGNLTAAATVTTTAAAAGTTQSYVVTGLTSMGTATVSLQVGAFNALASPSTYYAMPGETVTFTGSGFQSGETVDVFVGTKKVTSITANDAGSFLSAGSAKVGYDAANSSLTYRLVGATSKATVSLTIGVGQLNVMVSPSSYYVLPYAPFDVTASGLAANEQVQLMNGTEVVATAATNAKGVVVFTGVSLTPNALNSATLTARGITSNGSGSATIGMGSYYPTVTLSNYYAQPGTVITVSGSGFLPGESVTGRVGSESKTTVADKNGNASVELSVPFGTVTPAADFVMTGAKSNAPTTATVTIAPFNTQVTPSTYYAQPGSAINFTGSGFVAGEKVAIASNGTVVETVTASAKGAFVSSSLVLPYGKTANYTVTGLTSKSVSQFSIGLAQFYAGVQLDNYYGNGGSAVTASGSGFAANENVVITSGATILGTAQASATGAFTKKIAVPYGPEGKVAITATGATSGATSETSFTLAKVYTSVEMGSYVVKAGNAANIIGSGFLPNDTVRITADRGGVSFNATANANGSFNTIGYVIPANLPEGPLTLTIVGLNSYTTSEITIYVQAK